MIRIVLIEDLPIVLEGLKLLIDKVKDFSIVAEFSNGKEFIDSLSTIDADIVITDIDMPVMDGIMATKLALGLKPELRIIALSMYNDRRYYYEMITAGAKGFVLKQATLEELETAIREVYDNGSYFSPELLRTVIIEMQTIEKEIIDDKKEHMDISKRDIDILNLLCTGLSNKEIADRLFLSIRTIESAKSKLMSKTDTKNNASLIIWAIKNKVVTI